MNPTGLSVDAQDDAISWRYGGREPGARRKKFAGYLKAANELKQAYQQTYMQSYNGGQEQGDEDVIPGAFPNASIVRAEGGQEMIMFPSYAKRHVKQKPHIVPGAAQEQKGSGRDARDFAGTGDAEFWKEQWDQYEEDHAIVDIDVRGWLYTPHRGPMSRKNRIFVGLARQMVGIPAPPTKSAAGSAASSRSSSPTSFREKLKAETSMHEDEIVTKEAESILRKGEAEAAVAGQGGYSESPAMSSDALSVCSNDSRDNLPTSDPSTRTYGPPSLSGDDANISSLQTRASWNTPAQMSAAELSTANRHLMARLKPFLANPLPNTPISAFFYNDEESRLKTIETNASGQFSVRASLDFVPTHVRILASENISMTEEIKITEPQGVSVISDIDDTIKHSGISSGAREIFRNVFIRELNDLTINGVKDWYSLLASKGVYFHYVSNSPWQMYPVLTTFFGLSGLPPGSFHLKQYNGMFQGIFEPVAERKKSTLERILGDFPDRNFILIGDSGEADLEVYTDVVLQYPGRILGVFIRDVTTPEKKGFFDSAMGPLAGDLQRSSTSGRFSPKRNGLSTPPRRQATEDADMRAAIEASLKHFEKETSVRSKSQFEEERPPLPRRPTEPAHPERQKVKAQEENLIDLEGGSDQRFPSLHRSVTESASAPLINRKPIGQSPSRPPKPSHLRHEAFEDSASDVQKSSLKLPPPRPRKPSTSVDPTGRKSPATSREPQETASAKPRKPPRPDLSPQPQTYRDMARDKISSAYNRLPPAASYLTRAAQSENDDVSEPCPKSEPGPDSSEERPPPFPPRKSATISSGAAQYASSLYNSATSTFADTASGLNDGNYDGYNTLSKREELWKRRWGRAKQVLDSKGVMLRSWRVGTDAIDDSVKLVESFEKKQKQKQEQKQGEKGA